MGNVNWNYFGEFNATKSITCRSKPQPTLCRATGQLAGRLASLDEAFAKLKTGLGDTWQRTLVLAVTEFGRTVAVNGTRGTDHGVGGAAFMAGGAVNGGKVLADWSGLAKPKLHQGRDVPPAIDQRRLFKTALVSHLGVDASFVEDVVFPASKSQTPIKELLKG